MRSIVFMISVFILFAAGPTQAALLAHYTFDVDGTATVGSNAVLGTAASITTEARVGAGALALSGAPSPETAGDDGAVGGETFTWANDIRTVAFWVKAASGDKGDIYATMISLGSGTAAGVRFDVRLNGDNLRFEVQSGGTNTSTPIADGTWHHLVVVVPADGATVASTIYYLDGSLAGDFSGNTRALATGDGPLRMGDSYQGVSRDFKGILDDVRLYDHALSAAEISDLIPEEAPVIVTEPGTPVSALLGGEVTLTVEAQGNPLFYQWELGGVAIAGATNTSLVITNAGESAAGPYAVTVSNVLDRVTSSDTYLSFVGPDLDPSQQIVFQYNPIEITPLLPDDDGRTYQWRKDGVDLPGLTNRTLRTPPATLADGGDYDLVYSLGGNTVTSAAAGVIVPPDTGAAYADLVTGDSPRAYWRLGDPVGATVAAEEVALIAPGGLIGAYGTNTVSGEAGAVIGDPDTALRCLGDTNSVVEVAGDLNAVDTLGVSAPFTVEVWALVEGGQGTWRAPFAFVDWLNATYISGWTFYANNNNRWEFRTAEGSVSSPDVTAWNTIEGPSVELGQWAHLVGVHDGTDMMFYVNGVEVGSITDAVYEAVSFTLVPCTIGGGSALDGGLGTTGDYWIGKVDEPALYGHALSAGEILDHYSSAFPLSSLPVIDTQPQDLAVLVGFDAELFVGANSVTPASYQWLLEGAVLADETNAVLPFAVAQAADAGDYSVIVANHGGSVTSDVASLTVIEDVSGSSLSVSIIGFTTAGELISANGGSGGMVASADWNEVGPNTSNTAQPIGGLTDDQGAETGITLTWTAKTNRRGNWSPLVNGSHAMLTGFLESRDDFGGASPAVSLVVSNIPSLYTSGGYDLIVYMGAPAGAEHARYDASSTNFMAGISDGNQTFYYHGIDGRTWDGASWAAATTTDPGVVPPDANYAEFTGLTASTLTLTADAHPVLLTGPGTISGFQILPGRSAVPVAMTIGQGGGTVTVDWLGNGVLQRATDLPADNWSDVDGGNVTSGPYQVTAPQPAENFRLREP